MSTPTALRIEGQTIRQDKETMYFNISDLAAAAGRDTMEIPNWLRGLATVEFIEDYELVRLAAYEVSDEVGLMMATLYKAALGVGEFTELLVSDLRQEDRTLVVNSGTAEKRREVVVPADLANLLGFHVGDRSSGPLFMSKRKGAYSVRRIQQITRQVSEMAGLSNSATPEVIRQTRLEHLREAGMDEEDLRAYAG